MIIFHRFLIGTAILFCIVFAAWAVMQFRSAGGVMSLVLGITFALIAVAFGYYLKNLNRFLHR